MVRRYVAFLLSFLMLLSCFVACDKQPDEDEALDEPQDAVQKEPGVTITNDYVIVFPQGYNVYIDRAVSILQTDIKKETGVSLTIANDRSEAQEKEIVVGACNRFDAAAVTTPICVQGEKVIRYAQKEEEIYCIARDFLKNCIALGALVALYFLIV